MGGSHHHHHHHHHHSDSEVNQEAKPEVKPEVKPETHINLKVSDGSSEIFFKIKKTTPLRRLMEAFAKRQGKEMDSLRFLYDGIRIQADQTPEDLDMEDNDIIEAHREQIGGSTSGSGENLYFQGGTFDDLTEGQKNAFNIVMKAIKEKKHHVTINGPAGTGKTTLTKFIIEALISTGETGIILAAPTHAAKKILSKLSGKEASTIHSILKINPVMYECNVLWEQKEVPDLAKARVLICDEVSMYDRKLFKILLSTIPPWATIIGIGDNKQIRPVDPGENTAYISPFFTHKDFYQCELTEVMRSNAPIIDVATDVRNGLWIYDKVVDGHGVRGFTGDTALRDFMVNYFSIVKSLDDLFENRVMAFTNKSVDKLNSIIRKKIFETDKDFIVGEIIVMQEPLFKTYKIDGKPVSEIIFNNGQLVRIIEAEYTSTFVKARGVPGEYLIRHWDLTVETYGDDEYYREKIKIISSDEELYKFNLFLGITCETYKNWNKGGKAPWSDFWDAKSQFSKVKALPASTFHKAQGMSVDRAFIYTPCIHYADVELAQQLLYVGVTRGRYDVFYV